MKGKRTVVKKTTSSGAKVKSVESRSSKRLKETYKGDGIKSKQKSKNGIVRKTSTTLNGTKEVEKENRQGKRTIKSRGSQASLSRNGNVIKSKTREVTKANGTGHGKKKSTVTSSTGSKVSKSKVKMTTKSNNGVNTRTVSSKRKSPGQKSTRTTRTRNW